MKTTKLIYSVILPFLVFVTVIISCTSESDMMPMPPVEPIDTTGVESSFENLLTNQVNEIIIPTAENYQSGMENLFAVVESFVGEVNQNNFELLRAAYLETNLAYQAAAVHNYFATANLDFVNTTNLYPVDVDSLEEFIESKTYNFNSAAQQRANGFPAMDYLLYGLADPIATFSDSPKTATFLLELTRAMKERADLNVENWTGSLRENFINNGGLQLGSSISVQLNEIMFYYEEHVRGNKVGIPIGRLGPNDTPFASDGTKIEAYYQSLADENDNVALAMTRAAIAEMEDIYLGTGVSGNGIGYDDLLLDIDQVSLDEDIKAQYEEIYNQIDNRESILGDENLYNSIQALVTLYKSDLFPVLNVQDADGSNDGD